MFTKRETVEITTAADGTGIGYTSVVNGRILSVQYVKPTSGGFADGVDIDVTTDVTNQQIWSEDDVNASAIKLPRQAVHSTAGVAAAYAENYPILEPVFAAEERVKIAIASGGSGGKGTFHITIG